MGSQDQPRTSSTREKRRLEKVVLPNNFQILQGIREEGEIVEDEEALEEENIKHCALEEALVVNGEDKAGRRKTGQGKGQRGKGRGRVLIANSRGLVNAVVNSQIRKNFSRRNK